MSLDLRLILPISIARGSSLGVVGRDCLWRVTYGTSMVNPLTNKSVSYKPKFAVSISSAKQSSFSKQSLFARTLPTYSLVTEQISMYIQISLIRNGFLVYFCCRSYVLTATAAIIQVENIPLGINRYQLWFLFQQCGPIKVVRIFPSKDKSSKYAFCAVWQSTSRTCCQIKIQLDGSLRWRCACCNDFGSRLASTPCLSLYWAAWIIRTQLILARIRASILGPSRQ